MNLSRETQLHLSIGLIYFALIALVASNIAVSVLVWKRALNREKVGTTASVHAVRICAIAVTLVQAFGIAGLWNDTLSALQMLTLVPAVVGGVLLAQRVLSRVSAFKSMDERRSVRRAD